MPNLETSKKLRHKPPRLRIEPRWTIEGTSKRVGIFKRKEDAVHFFDGLRKAGLPER